MSALCVISSVVVASSRLTCTSASSTRMPVATSSAPVGSSHSSTLRPLGDGARDGDALLLAAGQLRGEVVGAFGQVPPVPAHRAPAWGRCATSVTSSTFSSAVRLAMRL